MIFCTDPGSEIEIPSFFFRSWFGIGKVGSGNRDKHPESVKNIPDPDSENIGLAQKKDIEGLFLVAYRLVPAVEFVNLGKE